MESYETEILYKAEVDENLCLVSAFYDNTNNSGDGTTTKTYHMDLDYWIANSDSFLHQIFMIVMGTLQILAFIFGVSYKAMNIYCYFVLFPLSFALFLKKPWKFLFIPISFLFFLIPGFEQLSIELFAICETFLNDLAALFHSDYIAMSVYVCVLVPFLLYLPFIYFRRGQHTKRNLMIFSGLLLLYLMIVYPFFKEYLLFAKDIIPK